MPVLNEISVGSVLYQVVSGAPTHSASVGVIALDRESGKYFIYDSDGWEILITPNYGGIYFTGSSVTTDTDSTTGVWYFDASTSIGGRSPGVYRNDPDMLGFTSSFNGCLRITDPGSVGRYLVRTSATFVNITDAHSVEIFPAIYSISGPKTLSPVKGITNEVLRSSATYTNFKMVLQSNIITELLPNQGVSIGKRYRLPSTATSGYKIENASLQVLKLEDAIVTYVLDEEWSTGSFSTNSWSVVNDTTNQWFIGTAATSSSGSFSAYISNTSGTTHTYATSPTSKVSHFYKDVTIPNVTGDFYLSFDWKANGEDGSGSTVNYDYGTVHIVATTTTPVAGTELTNTQATPTSAPTNNGRIGATTNLGKFNLAYGGADSFWRQELVLLNGYKGQTKRLVFGWANDFGTGAQPPFAVDNIKLFKRIYL